MAGFQNVLIVEDEVMIRELYYVTLIKAGYKTELAGDADETFAKLITFKPDIIFLDIMLPGMSGIDILKRLRTDPQYGCQDTRIVLITNLGQQNLAEVAIAERADGYVIKADIVPKDLIKIIHTLEPSSQNSGSQSKPAI
jgi:two-component system, OmpR family, phosphate regulon response regulator PhoB